MQSQNQTMTLRLLALAAFGSMASMRICDPMLGALGRDFSVSTGDASRVIASFALAYGFLQIFYGPLGDRLGKVRVITCATLGCALFSALAATATELHLLVLARAAMGATAAGIIPLSMAWIGDQVPYERRQETLGRFMGATVMGMMVGQWLGGLASESVGWRVAFGGLSALFLMAGLNLYFKTRGAAGAPPGPPTSMFQSVRNTWALLQLPRVRWVLTVTALEGAMAYGTLAFVPSQLARAHGFSASTAGAIMMLYGLGGLVYSQLVSRWLALLGERGLAQVGGALLAAALLVLAWAPSAWMAVVSCFFAGLGIYMLHNTLQTQATQMAPQSRGTAVTLFACVLFLGQSIGVSAVGATLDVGYLPLAISLVAVGLAVLGTVVSRQVAPRALALP